VTVAPSWRPLATPRRLFWLVVSLMALGTGAAVYRIPIQVTDSLEIIERVNATPSLRTVFVDALHSSRTLLRPLRQVQSALLLRLGQVRGSSATLTFRGFHALAWVLLLVLFAHALRPDSWAEAAGSIFALTVLAGLHTTAGMLREAYPVNHFLLIGIYTVAVYLLGRGAPVWWRDVVALACFVGAALTLESGLIVLPMAVAGAWAGHRGISRGALGLMALLALGYLCLRVGYLGMVGNEVGDLRTGFGLTALEAEQVRARFADRPLVLYAYTAVSGMLTVLLSQPINGTWTAVRDALRGTLHLVDVVAVVTSILTTALIGWYLASRSADGMPRWRGALPVMTLVVMVGSGVVGYAYAKSEIMSAAGLYYALLAAHAGAALVERVSVVTPSRRTLLTALALVMSLGWTVRVTGLQYRLERAAFTARNEWVRDESLSLSAQSSTPLASSLKRQALRHRATNPFLLPPVVTELWGDE
jgi:hypothetical protein